MYYTVTVEGFVPYNYDELVGVPEGCHQYCIGITTEGQIKAAFRASDDEPNRVIPEVTGSYTLVFPAPCLDDAKTHAHEVLEGYLDMCEVIP